MDREEVLLSKYGLTLEAYDALLQAQGGKCKICREPPMGNLGRPLTVDHDHQTGRIRGLLCVSCNSMLGMAKDNTTTLLKAIQYLKGNL